MGDLGRQPSALADANCLADAVEDSCRFVPHMRDMNTAVPGGNPGERDHLLDRRVIARDVKESGGQAEGALAHRLLDKRRHLRNLGRRGGPVDQADDLLANGALAGEASEIRPDGRAPQGLEKSAERHGRASIVALDERRHALPEIVLSGRVAQNAAPGVGVDVDEAGCDDQSARVDDATGCRAGERSEGGDGIPADADIRAVPTGAGAVHDDAASNQDVERWLLGLDKSGQ